jgi:hypothetical protein
MWTHHGSLVMFLYTKGFIQLLHHLLKSTFIIWYITPYMLKYKYQLHPLIYCCWSHITRCKIINMPHARILPAGPAILAQKLDLNLRLKWIWKRASEKQLCVLTLSSFNTLHFDVSLWVTSIRESNIYTHSVNSPSLDRISTSTWFTSTHQVTGLVIHLLIVYHNWNLPSCKKSFWMWMLHSFRGQPQFFTYYMAHTTCNHRTCGNTGVSLCNMWLQHTVTSCCYPLRTITQMPDAESLYLAIRIAAEMSFFYVTCSDLQ